MESQDCTVVEVSHRVEAFLGCAIAPTTAQAYKKAIRKWHRYASTLNWTIEPATPEQLAQFLVHLADTGSSTTQIQQVVTAAADSHAKQNLAAPSSHPLVKRVLTGIKKANAKPTIRREPLTFQILADCTRLARENGLIQQWRTFLWRMLMQFYAILRWDEGIQLRTVDLEISPQGLRIIIVRSKTDQLRLGHAGRVARQPGNQHDCPVNITEIYLRMLKFNNEQVNFLQPRIGRNEQGQYGIPDTRICYSNALTDLKDIIALTGRDSSGYGEHSGRRGEPPRRRKQESDGKISRSTGDGDRTKQHKLM